METLKRFLVNLDSKSASKECRLLDINLCLICTVHPQSKATGGTTELKFMGQIPFGGAEYFEEKKG